MKPPWWFCCGWRSPWCVIDTVAHLLYIDVLTKWACDRHDAKILGNDYGILTAEDVAMVEAALTAGADDLDHSEFYIDDERLP